MGRVTNNFRWIVLAALCCCFAFQGLNAQSNYTYATPELKEQVERETAEKYKKMGIEFPAETVTESDNQDVQFAKIEVPTRGAHIYRAKEIVAIDNTGNCEYGNTSEFEAIKRDLAGELDAYSIILDWENKKSYTIHNESGKVVETDISHIDESDESRVYGCETCDNRFTFRRISAKRIAFRYPYQDHSSGEIFAEYIFERGKSKQR